MPGAEVVTSGVPDGTEFLRRALAWGPPCHRMERGRRGEFMEPKGWRARSDAPYLRGSPRFFLFNLLHRLPKDVPCGLDNLGSFAPFASTPGGLANLVPEKNFSLVDVSSVKDC